MQELLQGFLSNESAFGRFASKCGIIIVSNLLFLLFSIPVITAGASYVALQYTMLKVLHEDENINPFKTFYRGFRENVKQSTLCWGITVLSGAVGIADLMICRAAGAPLTYVGYMIAVLGILCAVLLMYLAPVMAAFEDSILHLIRNAFYFAFHKPWKMLVIAFFHLFPAFLTYSDAGMMPLYAFCWFFFGFGALAMLDASLLLPEFLKFLPEAEEEGAMVTDEEKALLRDMYEMDGFM